MAKKFTRMKQEYSLYIAKISQSGRDGDDTTLYNLLEFYEKMHKLENDKARHDPPAHIELDGLDWTVADTTSTKKRSRFGGILLEEFIEYQKKGTSIWFT